MEQALKDELDLLMMMINKSQLGKLFQTPNNNKMVICGWVLTIKTDERGNPVKHKARLVAKGFSKVHLIEKQLNNVYNDKFKSNCSKLQVKIH